MNLVSFLFSKKTWLDGIYFYVVWVVYTRAIYPAIETLLESL